MFIAHCRRQEQGGGVEPVQTVDSWYLLLVGVPVDILSPVFHVEETGNVSTA